MSIHEINKNTSKIEINKNTTRSEIKRALSQDGMLLAHIFVDKYCADRKLLKIAMKQNGLALQYACDDYKNNESLVIEAVTQNGLALQYASDTLKDNENVIFHATKQNGFALRYASDARKSDASVVIDAVARDGLALQFASTELKNNKQFVKKAVSQNGNALQYASAELRRDMEIVKTALAQNSSAFQYIDRELQSNETLITFNLCMISVRLGAVKEFLGLGHDKEFVIGTMPYFLSAEMPRKLLVDIDVIKAIVAHHDVKTAHSTFKDLPSRMLYEYAKKDYERAQENLSKIASKVWCYDRALFEDEKHEYSELMNAEEIADEHWGKMDEIEELREEKKGLSAKISKKLAKLQDGL